MVAEVAKKNNLTWFNGFVTQKNREELHGHKGAVVWLTGLSSSGKSTIAHHLEKLLHKAHASTYVFDGDNVRHGLCSDLGFLPQDRAENIRRIGEMTKLFVDAGILAITAFISPYLKDRERIRDLIGKDRFFEIYVSCPVHICVERDRKGIYAKAMTGIIKEFTGVSAPYEEPREPSLTVHSDLTTPAEAAMEVLELLRRAEIVLK
jgi:adenylylsulfate kinase